MKNKLLFPLLFLPFALFTQNPISQEVTYELTIDKEWRKVSTIDYDYQGTRLTKETRRVYNNTLDDWYTQTEEWFDVNNNTTRKINRSFISLNSGFFVRDNQFTYSESGQLILKLNYTKERDNQPLTLVRRTEIEYLADNCSFLERVYKPNNSAQLVLSNIQLSLYDKDCRFARFIPSNNVSVTLTELQSRVRITYQSLSNGKERRILEESNCPTLNPCENWDIKEQLVFDAAGKNIVREVGSKNDFVRTLTTIDHEANQTVYLYRTFIKLNGINQVLSGIEEEILGLAEQPLYRRRAEPFVFEEWKYSYLENDLIEWEIYERSSKSNEGIRIYKDTTSYAYQFYCDGLPSEIITTNQDNQTRTTYSYLFPADCQPKVASATLPIDFLTFEVFPNPAHDVLNIIGEQLTEEDLSIRIIDAYGRIRQIHQNQGTIKQVIALNNLPNGTYFLQLINPKKIATKPFMIAR